MPPKRRRPPQAKNRTARHRLRGEYRPIHTVLLDGPDYQRLTADARHVFLVAKLSLDAAGIKVLYPGQLAARTGLPENVIDAALVELDTAGWVKRERNVMWVVDGLQYEPSVSADNPNHRRYVQRCLAGLPRLAILEAFKQRYAEWFADADTPYESHREPITNASQTPSNPSCGSGSGSKGVAGGNGTAPRTGDKEPAGFGQVWSTYPKREGGNSRRDAARAYAARLHEGVAPAELLVGVRRYRAYCVARGWVGTPYVMQGSRFFGTGQHYAEPWEVASPVGDGSPPVLEPEQYDALAAEEAERVAAGRARRDAELARRDAERAGVCP